MDALTFDTQMIHASFFAFSVNIHEIKIHKQFCAFRYFQNWEAARKIKKTLIIEPT